MDGQERQPDMGMEDTGTTLWNWVQSPDSDDGATEVQGGRAPRRPTLIHGVMASDGLPGENVIVRNISPHGMCIASRSHAPEHGETVRVALCGMVDVEAQVRWVGDGEFGVELSSELDLHHLGLVPGRRKARNTVGTGGLLEARLRGIVNHMNSIDEHRH